MPIVKARLITSRKELGGYIIYIFENLDWDKIKSHYIKVVRFPHWETPPVKEGDIGFLEYIEVKAGVDSWFDRNSQNFVLYNYDNTIFKDFIHNKPMPNLTVML